MRLNADRIKQEAERLKAEGVPPEEAWLRAIETEYRKAQFRKGAAFVERTLREMPYQRGA